jgi:amidase
MTIEPNMSECGVLFELDIEGSSSGPLKGKTFVVKDLFDVEGIVTGGGSPDWRREQAPARENAFVVKALLEAGARLTGKACTDELALSLDGINPYYGIPINTQLPDRIPGGSSSGSASAVAADFADFGLGTDTVGSIRIPSSYCGLYGFRPTHGIINMKGCMPLGQSFDTVGWIARDIELLLAVGKVLLPANSAKPIEQTVRLFKLFDTLPARIRTSFRTACHAIAEHCSQVNRGVIEDVVVDNCVSCFSVVRSREAWSNYGNWIETRDPQISPSVISRLVEGKVVSAQQELAAREGLERESRFLDDYLSTAGALLLPTASGFPPLKTASIGELDENRKSNIRLTVLATAAGLPQVNIPVEVSPGVKLGVSIIGPRGRDLDLLEFARRVSLAHSS